MTTEMTPTILEFTRTDPVSRPSLPIVNLSKRVGKKVKENNSLKKLRTMINFTSTAIVSVIGKTYQ